ncbi:hypothetical protein L0B53_18990 (plasmid) [Vibrio sp. SS-MA-C1-2]|uniref:hypothetical protein n=1 Tax=Vibrio sp. SS-MA-C1-2 TaxID=2908646 RepID=UPI001F42381C|nr:hypothetical protein [Vibrio sp. SS-MA-C1-2]UJF20223.1 hypothetical protein L0B53_18990 [Vibrio sp. SS-MA-C1-2]
MSYEILYDLVATKIDIDELRKETADFFGCSIDSNDIYSLSRDRFGLSVVNFEDVITLQALVGPSNVYNDDNQRVRDWTTLGIDIHSSIFEEHGIRTAVHVENGNIHPNGRHGVAEGYIKKVRRLLANASRFELPYCITGYLPEPKCDVDFDSLDVISNKLSFINEFELEVEKTYSSKRTRIFCRPKNSFEYVLFASLINQQKGYFKLPVPEYHLSVKRAR